MEGGVGERFLNKFGVLLFSEELEVAGVGMARVDTWVAAAEFGSGRYWNRCHTFRLAGGFSSPG